MRAAVRRFHSPDVDLDTFEPDDSENVRGVVQIMADQQMVQARSRLMWLSALRGWLDGRVREHGPLIGRHDLVVDVEKYDWARVKLYLTDDEESQEADTCPTSR
jgi:hypothetical protein